MLIDNLNVVDGRRLEARIRWEDCDLPTATFFIEFEADRSDFLCPDYHPFVSAALPPAMANGEHRIRIDGAICPRLKENLATAARLLRQWRPKEYRMPVVEPAAGVASSPSTQDRGVGLFFSGGLDSVSALLAQEPYPVGHPARARYCIAIDLNLSAEGFHNMGTSRSNEFSESLRIHAPLVAESGCELIVARCNLRALILGSHVPLLSGGMAAILSAVGHASSRRIREVLIGSPNISDAGAPNGTHPALDGWFSSSWLGVRCAQPFVSRMEKTRSLLRSERALQTVLPCPRMKRPTPTTNCGDCEKCLRTMCALIALRALPAVTTFQANDVSPQYLAERLRLVTFTREPHLIALWRDVVPALREAGRNDLARTIDSRLRVASLITRHQGVAPRYDRLYRRLAKAKRKLKRRLRVP